MEKVLFYVAAALIAVMVLTLWVNIIVAITKKVVAWDKFPVQVWVMIVAIASTLITAAAFAQYFNIAMLWYYWVAAIALAFWYAMRQCLDMTTFISKSWKLYKR